ncbi:PREDICTED: uncharacterized protein LOC107345350 [Acropora digitifera]|uniref:uncharacterized protein LOC107345350 n=1 Tax=Acropora digitifera TaxID=70779 RepID=UPI00077AE739|nr:PREDICTED: uncharacterized protein LOC107345350 [Acropora digitifera]
MLSVQVKTYVEVLDHPTDELKGVGALAKFITDTYKVFFKRPEVGSLIIILNCQKIESLELLWNDTLSGHLDKVAERYLVTSEMKQRLNLETVNLKTTIEEENYLNCRKVLTGCSGEADRTPLFSQQGGLDPETSMIGNATAGVEEEVLDNPEDADWLTRTEKAILSHDPRASPSNRQNNTFRELNVKPSTSQQCTILVEGLPNDATKDLVLNYFENKRRSKGGPVVDADMNSDSRTCRVIFESPDDAIRVAEHSPHNLSGTCLSVSLIKEFEKEEEDHSIEENTEEVEDKLTVIVSGLRSTTTKDTVFDYFENSRSSGGGEVLNVDFNEQADAVVTFQEVKDFKRLLEGRHKIDGTPIEVQPPKKKVPPDPVHVQGLSLEKTVIMDIKTFLDNIYEHVCCPLCTNRFTNPKQLPCYHSFCLHCLQRIQATIGTPDTILCPECRQNFTIPGNGDLNTLPTNFRLNSLLDALPVTEGKTSGFKCGNCDRRRQDSAYCFTCCSFWCNDCLPSHNSIKIFKGHQALALKDFGDEDFEKIFKQPAFCEKHEKEIELFCRVCKTAICNSCAFMYHEGHAKIALEGAANEKRLRIKRAIESKKRKVEKKETISVQVQKHAERVKNEVQHFTNDLMAAIEARKKKIFDEVEKRVKHCLERLGDKSQEAEENLNRHITAIEKCLKLLKRSSNAQIMQPNEFLDQLFRVESEQEDTVDSDGENVIDFAFEKNEELFNYVHTEELGFLKGKTNPKESTVEGKIRI